MELCQASTLEIDELSRFASSVFIDYYNPLIGPKQAEYMSDLFLSPSAIGKLIKEGALFDLLKENGEIIGFCEYLKEEDKVFLSKFYVRKDYRGKGAGSFMFRHIVNFAKTNHLKSIYLTVNKGNTPSLNVYSHLGFVIVDSVVNDIGQGYVMDDYIMEYTVNE